MATFSSRRVEAEAVEITAEQQSLRRRDLVLLPLISAITILALFAISEIAARYFWPEHKSDTCLQPDPIVGHKFKPNCVSRIKLAEGPWITASYNDCGYRSAASCSSKPPGTVRIVVIGSSFAEGYMVPYEQMFTTLVADRLSSACRKKLDFQNLGVPEFGLLQMYHRLEEAIQLKPDIALISVTSHDLHFDINRAELAARRIPRSAATRSTGAPKSFYQRFRELLASSRAMVMLQHFLYSDDARYTHLYLSYAAVPGFLRSPVPPDWQQHYNDADLVIGEMADAFREHHIPVFLMPGVLHDQAALVRTKLKTPGVDAFAFYAALSQIASEHHMFFVDSLKPFIGIGSTNGLFYPFDSHPTAKAQKLFADILLKTLVDARLPAFSNCDVLRPGGPNQTQSR